MQQLGATTRPVQWIRNAAIVAVAVALVLLSLVGGVEAASPGAADPTATADVFAEINTTRANRGLAPLGFSAELTSASQSWTHSMAAAGGISHATNLASGVPAGWTKLGENVGRGGTVGGLMLAFMNSPSHRANLLDPAYTHLGVGAVRDGGVLYTTHRFMANPSAPTSPPPSVPAPAPAEPTPEPAPVPDPAPAPDRAPLGNFDGAKVAGDQHRVRAFGWAFDPDVPGAVNVEIFVDGKLASTVKADRSRPDVQADFAQRPATGFFAQVDVSAGSHRVCAWVVGDGGRQRLGCRQVLVGAAPVGAPAIAQAGNLIVQANATPDAAPQSAPLTSAGSDGGRLVGFTEAHAHGKALVDTVAEVAASI